MQQNYLSIEPLLNFLVEFFVEKTRFLLKFFSNSEFEMRVYREKLKLETDILLYTFLRISPRKINIFKKTKLGPRELNKLNKLNEINIKKILFNITNILKSTTNISKKWKKNKSAQNFFILKYVIEHFKTSKFCY